MGELITIELSREDVHQIKINGKSSNPKQLDSLIADLSVKLGVDTSSDFIENKYLRLFQITSPSSGAVHETHVLERPSGLYRMYFMNKRNVISGADIGFPYVLMIIDFISESGILYRNTERVFFTFEPFDEEYMGNTLYDTNLSNIYKDGRACWGKSTVLPSVSRDTSWILLDKFFSDIKNNDLWRNRQFPTWERLAAHGRYSIKQEMCEKHPKSVKEVIKEMLGEKDK